MNDTIFAPATPPGRSAIAVLRLSGPATAATLQQVAGHPAPAPRRASVRKLRTPDGEVVDEAIVLWLPAPASYTGEDCAELHLHGGAAVVAVVADLLAALGLRMAEPGEFTRRAFEHGRMDLSQAEAVADLVDAETAAQRRQALAQLGGALTARYEGWRDGLLDVLALLEAAIDFPDEEIPASVEASARENLARLATEMQAAAADVRGERVRDGVRIALVGAPNVGKSSLLNALVGREAAIVTEVAGTTRDVIEVPLVLAGQLVRIADTAGLRATGDVIEAEGVRRARAWAEEADVRVGVIDQTRPETLGPLADIMQAGDLLALNKADQVSASMAVAPGLEVVTSAAVRSEVSALWAALEARVREITSGREFPAVTQTRHRALLREAAGHISRAGIYLHQGAELAAEDVRLAIRTLERVTGRTNPEAVLGRVFANFCIGK